MAVIFVPVVFILPIVTLIFSVRRIEKNNKGRVAIALSLVFLWVLAILTTSMISSGMNPLSAQIFSMIAVSCICAGNFILSGMGGFSSWKTGGHKRFLVLVLIIVPFCAAAGLLGYQQHLLSSIENASSWTQKEKSFQRYEKMYSGGARTAGEKFAAKLYEECPDLTSFAKLSDEDRLIYYRVVGKYNGPVMQGFLGDAVEDDEKFAEVLTFLRTAKKAKEKNLNYDFALNFQEYWNIIPKSEKEQLAKEILYQADKKYLILSYQEAHSAISVKSELNLASRYMIQDMPDSNMPETPEDVDFAIVVSSYLHSGGTYSNGIQGYSRTTLICVYDYRTGALLGKIDNIYINAPEQIQRNENDFHAEIASTPTPQIQKSLKTFFKGEET